MVKLPDHSYDVVSHRQTLVLKIGRSILVCRVICLIFVLLQASGAMEVESHD